MDKKALNKLLAQIYLEYGGAKTAELADTLKNLGYKMATKSGVTILNNMNDIPIEGRHLNYQYYISEANKIISEFVYQQLELF